VVVLIERAQSKGLAPKAPSQKLQPPAQGKLPRMGKLVLDERRPVPQQTKPGAGLGSGTQEQVHGAPRPPQRSGIRTDNVMLPTRIGIGAW